MIRVYYARAERLVQNRGFDVCLSHLDEKRKDKVLRTGDKLSQVRSLATGELLYLAVSSYLRVNRFLIKGKELSARHGEMPNLETAVYPGGKPYLRNYPQVHFNLSHSGDYVCCAIGDEPVGVDIQKRVNTKDGLAKRFFTKEENRMLDELDEEERKQLFFRMWSIKESYIKYTGQGMKQGLDTFRIDWNNNCIYSKDKYCVYGDNGERPVEKELFDEMEEIQAYFEECEMIDGYSLAVCTKERIADFVCCNAE